MLDDPEFRRWREEAQGALDMARLGSRHNWRCFLAEQAAQMAVKALLHGLGRGPWGQDLRHLALMVADAVGQPFDPEVERSVRQLSDYYIPARYPDAVPGAAPAQRYTAAEADDAVAHAERVLGAVDDVWDQLTRAGGT